MIKRTSGDVYGIRCVANGRIYIGSSVDVKRRFYLHRLDLRAERHHSPRLQNVWNKYGEAAFEFQVLEHVDDLLFLLVREQCWIWRNEAVILNCAPVAGSPLGIKRTDEQKARMKASKQAHYATPEGKAHMEAMHAKLRGRVVSAEERAMRSAALKGKQIGRVWTDEQRKAHSLALTGRKMPPVSEETRRKISDANKRRHPPKPPIEKKDRYAFLVDELPVWRALRDDGKSLREIERITGRSRKIIARELERVD